MMASCRKPSVNGRARKAMPGMAVLGTVAHFLPILSVTRPAGMIQMKTKIPVTVKRRPTWLGE